jgi:non-ribosomal peptide synthetase component F/alpha-ketoglutarate-dependent taurine dioxygenase
MSHKDIEAIYELSPQQKGMLFDSLQGTGSGIHVEQKIYRLNGELDVPAMERAWQHLVDRYTILRTAFAWRNQDQPLQVVLRRVVLRLVTHDWRQLAETEQKEKLAAHLAADRSKGFELSRAPLMRLNLFRTGDQEYQLAWTHHHIILDGWCRPIIDREIRSLYEAFSQGRELRLPPTRPYRDFIAWLKQQDLAKAESFWRQALSGIIGPTPLGVESDERDLADTSQTLGNHIARFPLAATNTLRSFARQNHLTVNTIVQGVWGLLLSRYSGQNDVVFGTTVSGRPADLESVGSMIGLFINTLPFRLTVTDGPLLSWFMKLQEQHLEARHYQFCSTGQIHQWSDVPGAQPLYESIVVFENYPTNPTSTAGIVFNPDDAYAIGGQTRSALNILVLDGSELELYIAYDRRRLEASDVAHVAEHIFILLKAIIGNPDQDLKTLVNRIPATQTPRVRRLPETERTKGHAWVAPRNATEKALARIWSEVLGIERFSVNDNFFELHGHSLLAMQVFARIREAFAVQLPLRCLFESPTIAGLAANIEAATREKPALEAAPLVPVGRETDLPLSFAQQRLWFLNQLEPDSPFYNVPLPIRIKGNLNLAALEQALNLIVARHEALRTVFVTANDVPAQKILEPHSLKLSIITLEQMPEARRETEALTLLRFEAKRPFDLGRGPMFRALLVRLAPDDQILLLHTHHIVSDGWSMAILFRELGVLYEACVLGKPSPLPPLKIQYADYAVWQRNWLQGAVLEPQLDHWKRQLAGAPLVLELPVDHARPPVQNFRGAKVVQTLTEKLKLSLTDLSRREGVTLFMTLMAAFGVLLSQYTGGEDIVVGTDLANRTRVETEDLIGFFVNLLPIRTDLSGNPTFADLLGRVKDIVLEAYAHQDVPFEKIVEALQPPRDLSRNPLVQVLFVMQNTPARVLDLAGVELRQFDLDEENSRFDLVLFMSEGPGLNALWVYNADLFDANTIARMSARFERVLAEIASNPQARVGDLGMLAQEQKRKRNEDEEDRREARLKGLKKVRKRGLDIYQLRQVKTSQLDPSFTLPLLVEPEREDVDLAEWAGANREFVHTNLLRHGALLFRGFDVPSVPVFEKFAESLCPTLYGEYGDLPREELGGKVYGSTPYPNDKTILFHNESSHMHRWPMLIWFYCVKAATSGGETPIVDCRRIYQQLEPTLQRKFAEKGLMYVRNFTAGLDVSWQKFFHTSDRSVVEDYCKRGSISFEWTDNDGLRTRQVCPAIVKHPQTGEMVFFNQLQLHHVSCLEAPVRESLLSMMREEDLPRNVYYGDGSKIEDSVMDDLVALYLQTAVSFAWQEQDIIMLNNMLVAHSRNPYVGERKIVVALGNLVDEEQIEGGERVP